MDDAEWVRVGIRQDYDKLGIEDLSAKRVAQATIYTRQDVMLLCRINGRVVASLGTIKLLLALLLAAQIYDVVTR